MKRILLALAIATLVLPATRSAEARTGVSIDFFYNNIGADGSWLDVDGYGYCWQPGVAVSNRNWRPYADGYWAYTNRGWTWVSYEDFGWATYHYGRWARLRQHGWVWVPGYEWGPAWVSWRTGGDYVGWAPLPPRYGTRGGEVVYQGRPINSRVDLEFNIGPAYYNFVNVRYIGEPVLRDRIFAPAQNVTYINQTVNVTNITYNNSVPYNYGPDYNRLSAYSTRPIQRLNLQQQTDIDYGAAGARSVGFTRVQGDNLVVAAPATLQRAEKQVAPPKVKEKVATPNFETGWSDVTDPQAKAKIEEKMKGEDSKTVPPPTIEPQNPAALTATSPAPGATPPAEATATPAAEDENAAAASGNPAPGIRAKGRGNGKRGDAQPPVAARPGDTPSEAMSPAGTPAEEAKGRGKDKGKGKREGAASTPVPAPGAAEATPPTDMDPAVPADDANGRGKGKRNSRVPANQPAAAADDVVTKPQAPAAESVNPEPALQKERGRGKEKGNRRPMEPAIVDPGSPDGPPRADVTAPQAVAPVDRGMMKKNNRRAADVAPVQPPSNVESVPLRTQEPPREVVAPQVDQENGGGNGRGRGRQKAERVAVPAAPQQVPAIVAPAGAPVAAPPPAPAERRKPEKGKGRKKGGEDAPPEEPGE